MTYATKLLEECTSFIKRTGIPVDQFCKMVKIHRQTFYPWMNGTSTPCKTTLNRVEKFLSSKRALDLLERDIKYVSISEAVRQTGQKYDKITSLCKNGVLDAVRSLGNHWLVNIEDLKKYVATKLPDNAYFECSPNNQCLAFGSLHSDFNSMWRPLLSTHNGFEIFDLERHEYLYQYWVSNKGEVFNATKCHLIESNKDNDGYIKVSLQKSEGRETEYLHRIVAYHANIHKALAYAVKMGRITSNPADMVELPKALEHRADFYTVDELKTVIDKARGTQIEPVVMLASWFGLRRGEIIGLRWSSISFDAKVLSITGVVKDKGDSGSKIKNMYYAPTAKTKSSLRSFPLNDEMVTYLKNLKAQQDRRRTQKDYNNSWGDFVCVRNNGDLIPLEYVSRAFPKLCEECGLRKLKLHELRHTNISLLLSEGASMKEVQEWAGHSNYSVTANTYAHVQAKSKSRLTESISSLLS